VLDLSFNPELVKDFPEAWLNDTSNLLWICRLHQRTSGWPCTAMQSSGLESLLCSLDHSEGRKPSSSRVPLTVPSKQSARWKAVGAVLAGYQDEASVFTTG
jgi:hypothetical protein